MGRNIKKGLEYFPLDVNFFSDIKIRKLIKYQGGKAITVYALLLCNIYKDGYFMRLDEELAFIISEQTGFEESYIQEVIKCCLIVGLFSKDLYDKQKILTSKGIQERYNSICNLSRRKCEINEFSLISSEDINISSEEIPINSAKSTQSKEKESKGNKTKETPPQTPPHGVASSSEAETFSNSLFSVRNKDTLLQALSSFGATNEDKIELLRLSNDGDPHTPLWELLESMKKSAGRISMSETVRCMQMYERQRLICCKSRTRIRIEAELRLLVKSEELVAILMALTDSTHEERCQQAMAEIKKSSGRITMPAKYILSELRKIK